MYFYETSSKEDINIEKIIETIVKEIKHRKDDSSLFSHFMKDSLNLRNSSLFIKRKNDISMFIVFIIQYSISYIIFIIITYKSLFTLFYLY